MSYALDTNSFVNGFTRMTSRRGTPRYVLTDFGTNFVGAEREIRELVHALDRTKIIEDKTVHHPVEWKFNPPSAHHFGGVFEAMVKSAKRAMKAILGNAEITDAADGHMRCRKAAKFPPNHPRQFKPRRSLTAYAQPFSHGTSWRFVCPRRFRSNRSV